MSEPDQPSLQELNEAIDEYMIHEARRKLFEELKKPMTDQPKICKNCKHCQQTQYVSPECKRRAYQEISLISGNVFDRGIRDCRDERTDYSLIDRIIWRKDSCGTVGKYYEAKEPKND